MSSLPLGSTEGHTGVLTMSKGSRPRPIEVPREEFRRRWDDIFGKKPEPQPKPPAQTPVAK